MGVVEESAVEVANGSESHVPLPKVLVLLALQAIGMVALGRALWLWSDRSPADFVTFSFYEVALGSGLALASIGLGVIIFRAFPRYAETLVRMQGETYRFLGPRLGWPAIIFISLYAGIGEEALFRGGLQTFLGDHVGPLAAIALSSAVFAVIHLGKPVITLLLFIVGVIFGVVFWLSESLLAAMIGHAFYDVWALRYLHREFLRLGLIVPEEQPLANQDCAG